MDARLRIGEHNELAAARANFHEVRLQLFEQVVVGGYRDHWHVSVDQRERAVLQLAGGIGLGVNVGNFLQLQRAFHRDRIEGAAAKEQSVVFFSEALGEFVNDRIE